MLLYRAIVYRVKVNTRKLHKITRLATLSIMVWNQKKGRVILFRNMGRVEFKFRIWIQKKSTTRVQTSNINSKLKRKDHVYELSLNMELIKIKNSTSMYELILKLKNKSKTQVRQYKSSPKNYHELLMISRAHDKTMILRN